MNLPIKLFLVACLAVGPLYFLYWEAGERFCSRLCPGNTAASWLPILLLVDVNSA